ncbi:hypothetical protein OB955_19465 [Halobacteria archaeon AArc-m2/3/4]|uniref:Uncharacterized protein n=1 Tax=Natronoglomus mannanivorans TaxID=2979990 RepID=A0AAP2Z401_9EURY|nr:hypothetical protein [Halobacteria archaeon AArc-xg1-1]MCU4974902.1 hypothetical protein [Halobacteria archaeon AArc-m2/3/4]
MSTDLLREDESVAQSIDETLPESVGDRIEAYGNDGTLALLAGVVATAQGLRTVRENRTGGVLTMLWGGSWLVIGLTQRQRQRRSQGQSQDQDQNQGWQSDESTAAGPGSDTGSEDDADLEHLDDIGDVTPGETDDEMAAANTLPPSDVGEPETQAPDDADATKTAAEPSEMTGPTEEDAAPETDKTSVPNEPPTDGVSMAGADGGDSEDEDEGEDADANQNMDA